MLVGHTASAQLTLRGKITDSHNVPVPGATVKLVETTQIIITDREGVFLIPDLKAGTYNFIVSYIGFETKRVKFAFDAENDLLNIVLADQQNALQSVEVVGRKEQSYKNTRSFSGTKTETLLKHVPQSVSYVTKEVIDDQQAFRAGDIIKNVSGASTFSYYNNDITLRGFRTSTALINGLRTATEGWSQPILANVERVEVIKGPASALFANTDPGGTVNTVTKKPLDENRKAINFATGSYNTYRVSSDFTGPMNDSKTLLYRLNLAYQNAESFRVLQGGEDFMIAPSFSFIPDDKTKVNFDFVYSKSKSRLDRGQPIFGATAGTDLNSTPTSFAIGKRNDFLHELNLFVTASLQRKISDHVSFNASYMKFMYDEDLLEHRTSNRYAVDELGASIPTLMEMQTIRRQGKNYNDNITMYVVSDFKTGPLEHTLLTGYDYLQNQTPVGNSSYNARGYLSADRSTSIATYVPGSSSRYYIVNGRPVPNVPHFDLVNPDYSFSDISNYINVSSQTAPTKYYVNGIYIQDQIKWGKLRALLALRQEYYTDIQNVNTPTSKKIEQKALIPRVGLVYSPVDEVNLYGTYTEGYQPQTAGTIGDPARFGGPFDPLISNMIEFGAKTEWFQNRLSLNLAVYRIEQNNILINANDQGNPELLRQVGQQQSKGFELDVNGMVMQNLSLTANFAYSEATITESADPTEIGTLLPNAPKIQGGFWAKYNFIIPELKGIGVGAGVNYTGKRNTLSKILTLPEYTIVNTALYYNVDKFKLSANLNNIFDKTHWVGGYDFNRLFPGTPRNFMVGIGYTF
ncbi:ferrichrome-iron receptor [Pedobacter sp. BAL39]|nr:ferrichrome-iron receptor [Pedobacter sp. BAL39]